MTTPSRMTCVRRLFVMEDESGRTWLAVEAPLGDGPEGGAMSHRFASVGGPTGDPEGGAMSHLLPGHTAEVEGDDEDQLTVVEPAEDGGVPYRMRAYRVSRALLPPAAEPAAT